MSFAVPKNKKQSSQGSTSTNRGNSATKTDNILCSNKSFDQTKKVFSLLFLIS